MTAYFKRIPLGVGRGAQLGFCTSPLVYHVWYRATADEDTPEHWQRFFDQQLAKARAHAVRA